MEFLHVFRLVTLFCTLPSAQQLEKNIYTAKKIKKNSEFLLLTRPSKMFASMRAKPKPKKKTCIT